MQTLQEKIDLLTGGKPNSLYLTRNDHWSIYETIETAVAEVAKHNGSYLVDPEECIARNEMWCVHYYPNNPIGFHLVYASTLEKALDKMIEMVLPKEGK